MSKYIYNSKNDMHMMSYHTRDVSTESDANAAGQKVILRLKNYNNNLNRLY